VDRDDSSAAQQHRAAGAGFPVGLNHASTPGTIGRHTLQVAVQGSASANGRHATPTTAPVNVNGGLLLVNSALQLGPTVGGVGAATNRGVLIINGGTARREFHFSRRGCEQHHHRKTAAHCS